MNYDYHVPLEERPEPPDPQYFAVSATKFSLLSFFTLGIYEFLWFYRNWKFVRERDGVSISPFWRAFFAPLHLHRLISDINAHSGPAAPISSGLAGFLFVSYLLLSALWRLPDPWWLISMFSWVALLPLVGRIADINRRCPRALLHNSRWSLKHVALGVVMVPFVGFMVTSTMNVIPSTQVVPGSRMWEHNVEFLRNAGMLEEGEEVLYFYSQDLLSMEAEGNMLTDTKVVSYWVDEDSPELHIETARYDEIAAVDIEYSYTFSDHTVITVQRHDGSEFILVVSSEESRDVPFVDELESRVH